MCVRVCVCVCVCVCRVVPRLLLWVVVHVQVCMYKVQHTCPLGYLCCVGKREGKRNAGKLEASLGVPAAQVALVWLI